MRRALALLLSAGLGSGCFVFEELDAADRTMRELSPSAAARAEPEKPEEAREPVRPARIPSPSGPGTLKRLQRWWAKRAAPSAPPRDPDDGVVRCSVRGKVSFSRKFDCLARGGRVESEIAASPES